MNPHNMLTVNFFGCWSFGRVTLNFSPSNKVNYLRWPNVIIPWHTQCELHRWTKLFKNQVLKSSAGQNGKSYETKAFYLAHAFAMSLKSALFSRPTSTAFSHTLTHCKAKMNLLRDNIIVWRPPQSSCSQSEQQPGCSWRWFLWGPTQ